VVELLASENAYWITGQKIPANGGTVCVGGRSMTRAKDQLPDEASYPRLAKFLRAGGTLEAGEEFSLGSFATLRRRN
jgi:hypothetical protein